MKPELQRYSVPKGLTNKIYELRKSENGEWVRYEDVQKLLDRKNIEIQPAFRAVPRLFCHRKLEKPGTNGIAVTYCMLLQGHEGECQ